MRIGLDVGAEEGVWLGSFVCGEMVGEPSGKAGQNAGHAPPRSGSWLMRVLYGKQSKVEQLIALSSQHVQDNFA